MVKIRQASTVKDIQQIIILCKALHNESDYYRLQPFDKEQLEESLSNVVFSEYGLALLAIDHNEVVGFFIGGLTYGLFNKELIAFDYSVYMVPTKRNTRIAMQLIKAFEKWAIDKGANRFRVGTTTDIHSDKTSRFYEFLGFKACGVSFEKVFNHGC
ncbi:GNAT family N-acetyltransferase [Entomomonas moraniae]|uniref:GNAT family N-acetyltransferase n=1 Tax=Entomomonas moraniae TaxID=2213226 RepID=A0A3S9XAI0_9GAMM|nr:GNAT family N-acetyltransferase [Entomomonas moraniae]AZS49338.1 GNAT family N-acetyltransferase [Entomomonas moraniae]